MPIFLVDGTLFASGNATLYSNQTLGSGPLIDQFGDGVLSLFYIGTAPDGTADPDFPLGDEFVVTAGFNAPMSVECGMDPLAL